MNHAAPETPSSTTASSASANTKVVDGPHVLIAVMGSTGSGKTSFINMASGANLRIGRGLQSCTTDVQVAQPFELDGRQVTLIDTPGFDDTTKSDTDILRMISAFLATSYQHHKKLAGVIYIHRISDVRMTGMSTKNFRMFRQMCGESTLKNVVIVTNRWGEVGAEVGEAREQELATQDMFFKPALEKGAQLLRHDNTRASAHTLLRRIVGNTPLSLQIQRELVDQGKEISQTAAGEELNRELMEQIEKHHKEMRTLQEEMKEAIRTKDDETKRELEIETKKLEAEINRVQTDAQKLAFEYNEEKNRMEQRMREMSESARLENERAVAEYNRQVASLRAQLDETSAASAGARADLERKIGEYNQEKNKMEQRMREMSESARLENEKVAEYNRQVASLSTQLSETATASAGERANLVRQIDEYNQEKNRMEQRVREMTETARVENERVAEYNRQVASLRTQLSETSSASADERADLVRQIDELRRQQGQNTDSGGCKIL